MKSTSSANTPDYLFFELFDRYVRRVADKCDIPQITDQRVVINKIDLSTLPSANQQEFEDWLQKRFYLRISIENALRRGMMVKVQLVNDTLTNRADYAVRIEGR